MKRTVSIFKNIRATATGYNRDVAYIFDRIRTGKSKDLVDRIRAAHGNREVQQELKKELPSICFSGTFKNRSAAGLVAHSGLICLDFDKLETEDDMIAWKDTLSAWEFTYALFVSPSGNGYKVVVKIPADAANHKGYFDALAKQWDTPHFDLHCSDVSRVCFESADPDIYVNEDALLWDTMEEPNEEEIGGIDAEVEIPMTSENGIISRLDVWFKRKYGMTKGSRNENLYRYANALNSFGIAQHVAEQHLLQFAEKDFPQTEVVALVKSAYRKTDRHHTRFFEDDHSRAKVEKLVRAGKGVKEIVAAVPALGGRAEMVDAVKVGMTVTDYWTYTDKGKIQLSPHQYKFFLEQNRFCKFYPEGSANYLFVKIESNLLEDTAPSHIKDFVLQDLQQRTDIGYGPFDYMASQTRLFKDDYLSMLDTADVNLKQDDADTCHLYYRNCALVVKPNSVETVDYMDLDGFVWKKHIIDRDYPEKVAEGKGMFEQFVWLISGRRQDKFDSLRSVAGYLLHSYKTGANTKAIIFNDETISDNPNGGSGKGLFCRAVNHMKRVTTLDGKQFSFDKSFPYQTVGADTQVLVFDDVRKNFAFEQLFSLITEGITLEKKNKDAIHIPVSRSPKLVITTNYTIGGVGGSFERRKFEVELSAYFGVHHTPVDEFGKMMFDEWDATEWARFDAFMVSCVQHYLRAGLVAHEFNNLDIRKFIKETSSEFTEWANDETIPKGVMIDKSAKYKEFIEEHEDFRKWLTQRKFTGWVEAYGKQKGMKVTQGRTLSLRWIMLGEYGSDAGTDPTEGEPF